MVSFSERITRSVQSSLEVLPVPSLVTLQLTSTLAGSSMVNVGAMMLETAKSAKGDSSISIGTAVRLLVSPSSSPPQ